MAEHPCTMLQIMDKVMSFGTWLKKEPMSMWLKYFDDFYTVTTWKLIQIFVLQATDKHGISALLAAIWEGHTNCVKLLLDQGAKSCGQTPDGVSYLDAAEKDEIKELLKSY